MVHLLNLNIERLSSFQDRVQPAEHVGISCRVPFKGVRSVRALTADQSGTSGPLEFSATPEAKETLIETKLPRLDIATIVLIER